MSLAALAAHMKLTVAETVVAYEAAYDELAAEWAGEAILESPAWRAAL